MKIPVLAALCAFAGTAACARFAGTEAGMVWTPEWVVPTADKSVVYTATKCIRAFATGRDGAIWAATDGGVLRLGSSVDGGVLHLGGVEEASLRVWTTADGLVSNDVRAVAVRADGTVVTTSPAGGNEIASGGAVTRLEAAAVDGREIAPPPVARTARGVLTATVDGLFYTPSGGGGARRPVPFPAASRASHVSALAVLDARKNEFAAGLYGDGVYRVRIAGNGAAQWRRVPVDHYRFVTALSVDPDGYLVVGTRHSGVFARSPAGDDGFSLPIPRSLPSGDIYGIAAYKGRLIVSTFDRGVLSLAGGNDPAPVTYPEVSQGRTLVPFGSDLYALHADHSVWRFDGRTWQPAWPKNTLRRTDVYSIALDRAGGRLLVGGWGGWAEWDGVTWRQHWNTPGLAGESITAIAADAGGAVWVGTQRRGLFRCDGDAATPFQEAQGLTDDWITAIAVSPKGRLLVGTYTGGLLEKRGERFERRFAADKWAMRRIAFHGEKALVATPVGLYREGEGDHWEKINAAATAGPEIQALLPAPDGVWVGTRNGLAFVALDRGR